MLYWNQLTETEYANTEQPEEQLLNIILKTVRRGGTVIIPSFAVGRTQEIIYHLNKYYDNSLGSASDKINELKRIPVYIDSPLAKRQRRCFGEMPMPLIKKPEII